MELPFLLLLWELSHPRIAELREMPQSFSIKLHSEAQVSGRLGMSGGRSSRHAQNPLLGERRKTLSITIFPHKARCSRGRRLRPCWNGVKTLYWSGDFLEIFFLFDPSLTSGMSAALMQGHFLRHRPCIKQHTSDGREFHRKYHRQLHISPDTRRYMRQGWNNVEPTSQTVGQHWVAFCLKINEYSISKSSPLPQ